VRGSVLGIVLGAATAACMSLPTAAQAASEVVAPADGVPVAGKVRVAVTSPGSLGSARFAVDGRLRDTDVRPPFAIGSRGLLDTRALRNGRHRLTVKLEQDGTTRTVRRTLVVRNAGARAAANDTTRPTVSWRSPAAEARVAGSIGASACEVLASDNVRVDRVVFSVGTSPLNTERYAPWNCAWDTRKLADGRHVLKAVVVDSSGNRAEATRAVVVDNVPDATPSPAPAPAGCADLLGMAPGTRPAACWRPYAAASPFNKLLPADPALHPRSGAIVNWMKAQGPMNKLLGNVGGTKYDWAHPTYFAKSTDPVYTIRCSESANWGACEPEGKSFRIPREAKPAGYASLDGYQDKHLAVVQPDGTELDLWQSTTPSGTGGTLRATYGGLTRVDGDGLGSNSTAAMFGAAAGMIRFEELEAGTIEHALFGVVRCTSGSVFPAAQPAAVCGGADAPPNGARLVYTAGQAEIDAMNAPAWAKIMLTAMRRYGVIVGDTGGGAHALGLMFESGMVDRAYGRPEKSAAYGAANGVPSWDDPAVGRRVYTYDIGRYVDVGRLRVVDPSLSR
jgi:hypothetical protein